MSDYEIPTEDLVTAFVDAFNAHNLDVLTELLADDAALHGIVEDADTTVGVLQELQSRSPWMTLARGEVGLDPVAAIWVPDEHEQYRLTGYFAFEAAEEVITRIELFEEVPEDLLSESPTSSWAVREIEATDADIAADLLTIPDVD